MELLIANLYLNGKDIKDINAQLFDLDALIQEKADFVNVNCKTIPETIGFICAKNY